MRGKGFFGCCFKAFLGRGTGETVTLGRHPCDVSGPDRGGCRLSHLPLIDVNYDSLVKTRFEEGPAI